jgi:hypothetical protein
MRLPRHSAAYLVLTTLPHSAVGLGGNTEASASNVAEHTKSDSL